MMFRWHLILSILVVALPGCSKSSEQSPASGQEAARVKQVSAYDAGARVAADARAGAARVRKPAPLAPLTEKAATELLTTWRESQNKGDFATYSTLYGTEFKGVRRSGKREVALDKAGWLKERQRMFARPMFVETADIEVALQNGTAQVAFTQRWESGRYADVGPKTLTLVATAEGPRIVDEAMQSSQIVAPRGECERVLPTLEEGETAGPIQRYALGKNGPVVCVRLTRTPNDDDDEGGAGDDGDGDVGELGSYDLAVLVRRGKNWQMTDEKDFIYANEGSGYLSSDATATFAVERISPTVQALRVTEVSDEEKEGVSEYSSTTTLFRVVAGKLKEIFAVSSEKESSHNDSSSTLATYRITDKLHRGYYIIKVGRSSTSNHWEPGSEKNTEENSEETWRWNGDDYEPDDDSD